MLRQPFPGNASGGSLTHAVLAALYPAVASSSSFPRTGADDWSGETCAEATVEDLDPKAIAAARAHYLQRLRSRNETAPMTDDATFLEAVDLVRCGSVTNAAMLLLGRFERAGSLRPVGAGGIRWTLREAGDRTVASDRFGPPLLFAVNRARERLRESATRRVSRRPSASAEFGGCDEEVLREALHNAIVHQDYRAARGIRVTEHANRVVISNAGDFRHAAANPLAAPLTYRNTLLTRAMIEFGLIEAAGGGIRRMFERQRDRRLPSPGYDRSSRDRVRLVIARLPVDDD